MTDMDEKEVRRIIDCEVNKLKESIEKENICDTEKLDTIHNSLREEIEHKFNDNKERIEKESGLRERDIAGVYSSMKHKWDFVKWMVTGIFSSMAIMGGTFYTLIKEGDAQAITELCQQGSYLMQVSNAQVNTVIGYLNQLGIGDRFLLETIQQLPNCQLG